MNKPPDIIITTAASGAGKSTFSKLLCDNQLGWVSVEADSFFYDSQGNYNFDASKLGLAHKSCQDQFLRYLKEPSVKTIIVANTNTKPADYKFYEDAANKLGCRIFHIIIQNRHGNENVHNVPFQTLDRQKDNILNNIKL